MLTCSIEQKIDSYDVKGPINFDTVSKLYKQGSVLMQGTHELTFNFVNVTYADSSAIALLLSWLRIAKERKLSLLLNNLPAQLLEIANVCEVMPFLEPHMRGQHG
jgi:phospholipid transport system transporter-binding protein